MLKELFILKSIIDLDTWTRNFTFKPSRLFFFNFKVGQGFQELNTNSYKRKNKF